MDFPNQRRPRGPLWEEKGYIQNALGDDTKKHKINKKKISKYARNKYDKTNPNNTHLSYFGHHCFCLAPLALVSWKRTSWTITH